MTPQSSSADYPIGYCTNVHAGTSLEQARANLLQYAGKVRSELAPHGRLPVGLWLAEEAANELIEKQAVGEFRDWLESNHFLPYTMNGFPQGDFHQAVVKHAVYEPTWSCHSRARYSMCLAQVLDVILPAGANGSISTLPIGWPHCPWHAEEFHLAADNLLEVAKFLDHLAQSSGREIVLAIEPEPGCILNTADELAEFFQHYLFSGPDAKLARRYLTVCHDVCHSGVMFEPQLQALETYRKNGIRVGKVQISSAVHVPWDQVVGRPESQAAVLAQLRSFNEPKYLHQTTRSRTDGRFDALVEDLPQAFQKWMVAEQYPTVPWRVHFHVPIYVNKFGELETTQADIKTVCDYLKQHGSDNCDGAKWFTGHYEVETYAWPVLPPELQQPDLAHGIAHELRFAKELI
ncbi:MAG: metabolite traffic protein EboE [Pirellulaceae bacterium]|nr:metabolite traffic protein EboE [Pirellulaceae bacterium]